MIDLSEVGAFASDPTPDGVPVKLGIYLPGIGAGFQVVVLVVHSVDRFTPGIQPQAFDLEPTGGPNGLWSAAVTIGPQPGTSFGLAGRYLYRYQLLRVTAGSRSIVTPWFTDPVARATDDVGQLSAFDTPTAGPAFSWHDDAWKVPELEDLVVYEMQIEEFNGTFQGVVDRLAYLTGLGVTCLELMPVTSLKLDFDWGYGPLHFLAPNQRWGGPAGLKHLVDSCHSAGVAVILDVVFQHVDDAFAYYQVYRDAGVPSPMIGGLGPFGQVVDYQQQFARDYVHTVTSYLLEEYHVDGFRYDEVTDLYDGPTGVEYASFAYDVYGLSLRLSRFTPSGGASAGEYSRVIQVPEALNRPQEILRTTYSSATWQDGLLNKAEDMARLGYVDDAFAHLLDADFGGYPRTKTVHDIAGQPVDMPVAPFQYANSHDHSHLIAFLSGNQQNPYDPLADRSRWYKIQPFIIAQYTASGIPMLWQGQEFSDNYVLASNGNLRVHFRRDAHWEYFYDPDGAPLIRLHRILGQLRAAHLALRGRDFFYYNQSSSTSSGIIGYRRSAGDDLALVFLNFSDTPQTMTIPFPSRATFRERVDAADRPAPLDLTGPAAGDPMTVTVPANYGYVFTPVP
jgi:1,4-alpha-glucan branching enzyme